MKLGFIGAGNMASAIISGIRSANLGYDILAFDLDKSKVQILNEKFNVDFALSEEIAEKCDYIILAIKPQNFSEVLDRIKSTINKNAVIISIAAGITPDYITKVLRYSAKVVQVMPNTPLMLGIGATALAGNSEVTSSELDFAEGIFKAAGVTARIPLDKMNEVIAINGSSPAFIYEYTKYFIDYADSVGIDKNLALSLFAQTLKGSAEMLISSGKTVDELIEMVCSKGGTTIEGVNALRKNDLAKAVSDACENCTKRAYELSK